MTTTKRQLNLVYATNIPVPFMLPDETGLGIVLIPSDQPIPPVAVSTARYADFEFQLDYEDITRELRFPENSREHWTKFFLPHDYVPECVPPPPSPTETCGPMINPRSFAEYVAKTRANRRYIETTVTTRTWFWRQIGTARNIHWCFYSIDMATKSDYNYGTELLEALNAGVESMKRGRYIVNQTGKLIISGSWILKRAVAEGSDIPRNVGNVLIDGVEYSYESIFGGD